MNDLTLYNQYRSQIKTGDLLIYDSDSLISDVIKWWSPGASHAGLALDLDLYEGLRDRRWTIEAVRIGVRTALLSNVLEHVHGRVYWHALKPEYDQFRQGVMCFALDQVGVTGYDFWSLITFPIKVASLDLSKLLCSECVVVAWIKGGIPIVYDGKRVTEKTLPFIPKPSQLAEFGVTLPPVLIAESDPVVQHPPVQP